MAASTIDVQASARVHMPLPRMILKNLIDPDAHDQCAAAWVEATGWRAQRATHTVFAVSERVVSKQLIYGC